MTMRPQRNERRYRFGIQIALAGLLSFGAVGTGCEDCTRAADEAMREISRVSAAQRKCCSNKRDGTAEGDAAADACLQAVNNQLTELSNMRQAFLAECGAGNAQSAAKWRQAFRAAIRVLLAVCTGNFPLLIDAGNVMNISSVFANVDSVTVHAEPRKIVGVDSLREKSRLPRESQTTPRRAPKRNSLTGTFAFSNQGASIQGGLSGYVAWTKAGLVLNEEGASAFTPIDFTLDFESPAGTASFRLIEFERNMIKISSDGTGTLFALLSWEAPEYTSLLQEMVWVEIPVLMGPDGLSIEVEDMPGLEFAPEAPNQIADWDSNFTVDMFDYTFFLEEMAEQRTDLNGDGVSDARDFAIFETAFYAEFDG